jgi:hypothetical protein
MHKSSNRQEIKENCTALHPYFKKKPKKQQKQFLDSYFYLFVTMLKSLDEGVMEGPRILASMHRSCEGFRKKLKEVLDCVKEEEFVCAYEKVVAAQKLIEGRRLEELQRLAESESRPMTALEKVRLLHLQSLPESERSVATTIGSQRAGFSLSTPFPVLLEAEITTTARKGTDMDEVIKDLVNPFIDDLLLDVDKSYRVNNQLMQLTIELRQEALRCREKVEKIEEIEKQFRSEMERGEHSLKSLKAELEGRNRQIDQLRSAYMKEVVQIKEQFTSQAWTNVASSLERATGRAFDCNLVCSPLGLGADGRNLDEMVNELSAKCTVNVVSQPLQQKSTTIQTEDRDSIIFEQVARIMKLENENVALRLQQIVLRLGLEGWRAAAENRGHVGPVRLRPGNFIF